MLRKILSTEDTEDTDGWELDGIILGSLRLEILEEIFLRMAVGQKLLWIHGRHGGHGGHGSSDFKRNLNGYFGVARAQEIFGGNLC